MVSLLSAFSKPACLSARPAPRQQANPTSSEARNHKPTATASVATAFPRFVRSPDGATAGPRFKGLIQESAHAAVQRAYILRSSQVAPGSRRTTPSPSLVRHSLSALIEPRV